MSQKRPDRILVVDDDPAGCRVLGDVLGQAGWQVDTVTDATAALTLVREGRYGLVIADVDMPGISGTALVTQLARTHPALPALLVSCFPDERTRREARALGVPLVAKPFRDDVLRVVVGHLLGGADAPEAGYVREPARGTRP